MKDLITGILLQIIFFITIFSSCTEKDFDAPLMMQYGEDIGTNITISDLKAKLVGSSTLIDSNLIIKGTVVSSDMFGSFYKELIIQDSTGGIVINIDNKNLNRYFPPGQLVYVKCNGLYISKDRAAFELGTKADYNRGRIPIELTEEHLIKGNGGKKIVPRTLTIDEIPDTLFNTIIKLNNVQFIESDLNDTYAEEDNSANRTIEDCEGNTIILRTSNYASFALDSIPKGKGSIIAVLNIYNGIEQLFISSTEDVDMTEERCQ